MPAPKDPVKYALFVKRLRESHLGLPSGRKGKKASEESRLKMSIAAKRRVQLNPNPSFTTKGMRMSKAQKQEKSKTAKARGYGLWMKGRKLTFETRLKQSVVKRGDKAPAWKGGVTPDTIKVRSSLELRWWREHVFKRDDYTCQACGARGVYLHADHELPFARFPDLRFEILNGQTLCRPCHKKKTRVDWDIYKFNSKNVYA